MPDDNIPSPSLALAMAEPLRATSEFAGLLLSAPILLTAPRGDGHSVLVLPGFGASDMSTSPLRLYLSLLGYHTAAWALGRNMGYRTLGVSETRLRGRVRALAAQSGGKISLVGWSLGGVMARHMAREHPECIRQVITLGAPFTGNPMATSIRDFYETMSGESFDSPETLAAWRDNREPPLVPTTSIYSKTDGITAWQNCLEIETDIAENIEVFGSHAGLPHNPLALYTIAKRLARVDERAAAPSASGSSETDTAPLAVAS